MYGCSHAHIGRILKQNNISLKTNKNYRKYKLNLSFFEKIDSHEKAAILGFLFADGYNNSDDCKVRIGIHKKDIDYLQKFNEYIQPDKPKAIRFTYSCKYKSKEKINKDNKDIAYTVIYCKKICDDLTKLGCIKNKSLIVEFPQIDIKFIPSFLLGYFDGDGSISHTTQRKKRQYMIHICVSDAFGKKAKDIIESILNIHVGIRKQGKISSLFIGGNIQVEKFLNWIYGKSSIRLNRKYKIYQEMIEYLKYYK